MARGQVGERCPSAEVVGPARLPGRRLAFTRYSQNWRCGVSDAVADAAATVWGVLYIIDADDLPRLDKKGGLPRRGPG
jgi:hypothetical protein